MFDTSAGETIMKLLKLSSRTKDVLVMAKPVDVDVERG
jgi:hypothetical protein